MDTTFPTEQQILADIDKLRDEFTQTQDLYREVCTLLFFRYGMTPTANKLYQFVRKGSMSAPAEALNKFWEELREKSRVRIEHPDLPEALKITAGNLVATIWTSAQTEAQESVAFLQSEAESAVIEAKTARSSAENQQKVIEQTLHELQAILEQTKQQNSALGQELAASNATRAALESQLSQAREEHILMQQRLLEARQDFTVELEKQRQATTLAEERCRAVETRSLLEIDRERSAALKLQKELEVAKQAAISSAERHNREIAALQEQLGDIRQKTGVLEGNLQAVTTAHDLAVREAKNWQMQAAELSTRLSALSIEATNWQRQAEEAQRVVAELCNTQKPLRASRKSKLA